MRDVLFASSKDAILLFIFPVVATFTVPLEDFLNIALSFSAYLVIVETGEVLNIYLWNDSSKFTFQMVSI